MVKIRSFLNFKNQRGIVFIYSVFFFIVALGFVALAADLGFAYVVSTELKSVADAAALTAAASFLTEMRQRAEADDDLPDAGVADAVGVDRSPGAVRQRRRGAGVRVCRSQLRQHPVAVAPRRVRRRAGGAEIVVGTAGELVRSPPRRVPAA